MDQGENHPDFVLGQTFEDKQEFERARKAYETAADKGSAWAAHNLGVMCLEGRGAPQDYSQAAIWFRKAAEGGLAASQANLGLQYAEGTGVIQDHAQALQWIRKSAEQGFADGQYKLGIMYLNGYGVAADAVEGYKWMKLAAAQGHSQAIQVAPAAAKRAVMEVAKQNNAVVFTTSSDITEKSTSGKSKTTEMHSARPPKGCLGMLLLAFVLGLLLGAMVAWRLTGFMAQKHSAQFQRSGEPFVYLGT